jgi:peptidoglycan L-alanyl-D-glutamate endopeptidase CwlK
MPQFSKISKLRLSGCHPDLQRLMNEAIKEYDFAVICGYRSQQEQDKAFADGKSKLKYPNSKHNLQPSMAVDIAPVKYTENRTVWIDWQDIQSFLDLHDVVQVCAAKLGIEYIWGGDWDGNPLTRNKFNDYVHYQLKD